MRFSLLMTEFPFGFLGLGVGLGCGLGVGVGVSVADGVGSAVGLGLAAMTVSTGACAFRNLSATIVPTNNTATITAATANTRFFSQLLD